MKYKLTKNKKTIGKITLYQIEALKDFSDIKKGDLGGWIEKESNLSQQGDCWVSCRARVSGNAIVSDNAWVFGNAWVSCRAWVSGNARVFGNARVSGNAWVSGCAIIN
jgi:carbonic anhydrase/acetyltransferase-like protein (isoleucine patch superfamily)